jgi:hypothetical protein
MSKKHWCYGLRVAALSAGGVLVAGGLSAGLGWTPVVFGGALAAIAFERGSHSSRPGSRLREEAVRR